MSENNEIQVIIENGKYGFVDNSGKLLIYPVYDYAAPFSEGLALVCVDGKLGYGRCGYINVKGEEVIPCQYSCGRSFSEGLAQVEIKIGNERLNGFINKKGEMAIPPSFHFAKSFFNGIALVCIGTTWVNGKYGAINKEGKIIIPLVYDYIEDECEGYFIIKKEKKWGVVNRNGVEVIPPIYEKISSIRDGQCEAVLNEESLIIKLPL